MIRAARVTIPRGLEALKPLINTSFFYIFGLAKQIEYVVKSYIIIYNVYSDISHAVKSCALLVLSTIASR